MAATRVHRPIRAPIPTASSPKAISRPTRVGAWVDSPSRNPIGLRCRSSSIWLATELGSRGSR